MCSTLIVVAFLCVTWIIAHHRCSTDDCGFEFFGKPTAIASLVTLVVAEFLYVRRIVQLENEVQELKDNQENLITSSDNSAELPTYEVVTCSRSDIVV